MTPQQIEAMKLALEVALEALEKCRTYHQQDWSSEETTKPEVKQAITAIKEALAQTQEPVATVESVATVVSESGNQEVTMSWWHEPALPVGTKLYTTPPQRLPLTDKTITRVIDRMPKKMKGFMVDWDLYIFTRAIEAAHGIKENT